MSIAFFLSLLSCAPFNTDTKGLKFNYVFLGKISETGISGAPSLAFKNGIGTRIAFYEYDYKLSFTDGGERWVPYKPVRGSFDVAKSSTFALNSTGLFTVSFLGGTVTNANIQPEKLVFPNADLGASGTSGSVNLYAIFDSKVVPFQNPKIYLYADSAGTLTCEVEDANREVKATRNFLIKNESLKVGNDFLLDFVLHPYEDSTGISSPLVNISNPQNSMGFFAIIDRQLLLNADMFIDERVSSGGPGNDPNDAIPGNKQKGILPVTWHANDLNPATNVQITNSVVYNLDGQDDVDEYNEKMRKQKEVLRWLRREDRIAGTDKWGLDRWEGSSTDTSELGRDFAPLETGSTLAPGWGGPEWENYVFGQKYAYNFEIDRTAIPYHLYFYNADNSNLYPWGSGLTKGRNSFAFGMDFNFDDAKQNHPNFFFPYAPGNSSHIKKLIEEGYLPAGEKVYWFHAGQSAGVDCVGFVYRSGNYTNNPYGLRLGNSYVVADGNAWGAHPWTSTDAWSDPARYSSSRYVEGRSYLYYAEDENIFKRNTHKLVKVAAESDENEAYHKILPGDLYYRFSGDDESSARYHCGVIYSVDYSGISNRSQIGLDRIRLIESNHGKYINDSTNDKGCVIKDFSMGYYADTTWATNWRVGRFKQ